MIEELPLASWGNIRPLRRKEGQEKMDRPSVLWPEAVDSLFRNGAGLLPHVNLDGKNGAVARRPSHLVIKADGREKKCLLLSTWII